MGSGIYRSIDCQCHAESLKKYVLLSSRQAGRYWGQCLISPVSLYMYIYQKHARTYIDFDRSLIARYTKIQYISNLIWYNSRFRWNPSLIIILLLVITHKKNVFFILFCMDLENLLLIQTKFMQKSDIFHNNRVI